MKPTSPSRQRAAAVLATVGGVLLLIADARAQSEKPVRGEPIRPAAPRGAPIQPAAPAAPRAESGAPADVTESKDGYLTLGFERLASFDYTVPEYTGTTPPPSPDTNQIPTTIKAFDGKKVAVKGFMLPLKVEGGRVTELLLMRDQSMCCFGTVPKINEFVTVKMVGGGTKAVLDQAVTLFGKIKVGEFSENGYLLGIYQLDGDRAEGPGM